MINRKGALTAKQLIGIIILVVSFAVLLMFFYSLNLRQQAGEQACRSSLVWRNIPLGKQVVTISCESQDICISMGGECSGVGANVVEREIVEIKEIDDEMQSLSQDCYAMTGSGEIKFDEEEVCGICYVVYFDDLIQEEEKIITNKKNVEFSTEEPIAIIVKGGGVKGDYTSIISSQYNSESLKNMGCKEYLF